MYLPAPSLWVSSTSLVFEKPLAMIAFLPGQTLIIRLSELENRSPSLKTKLWMIPLRSQILQRAILFLWVTATTPL